MKRALQLLIALAISAVFFVSPVAAATNQGLEWAVASGDAFNFHLTSTGVTNMSLNEALYMNITSAMPAIPNSMTTWAEVPYPDVGWWWSSNGTTIGLYGLLFLGLLALGTPFVLPTGNFTLLGNLIKTYVMWNSTTTHYANSTLYWGLTYSDTEDDETNTLQVSYLKSDGVLARYVIGSSNSTSHETVSVSFIRDNLPAEGFDIIGFIQQNMLLVGAGVLVIVIIGAVVCMKRK
ncbi:MAG: hypothetical protein C4K47_09100 [Candidatus Thorarchaeota archaeon]|nr:MAG: hypothetical protein C4K47_09100 [Candidatus Thorarchaeota archaeon]